MSKEPPLVGAPLSVAVPIPVAGLEGRVFFQGRSAFGAPQILLDGKRLRVKWGRLSLTDDRGRSHMIRVRGFLMDPCPRLEIDGMLVDVFPRLPIWVGCACAAPLMLMFVGGAAGAVFGVLASYGNFRLARSGLPILGRWLLGLLATSGAFVGYLAVAAAIEAIRDRG